ncbi:uncharacterized protein LOC130945857 [Arachis stenosperma]|uniref:uncharacterized protein LOC130945857 n=1 Tax=Arachis stenosperma TaxID=217475 RepID=UPI0025ABC69C|nr:uncharacterized protein LOC130945857 [Arachis stenosperma]
MDMLVLNVMKTHNSSRNNLTNLKNQSCSFNSKALLDLFFSPHPILSLSLPLDLSHLSRRRTQALSRLRSRNQDRRPSSRFPHRSSRLLSVSSSSCTQSRAFVVLFVAGGRSSRSWGSSPSCFESHRQLPSHNQKLLHDLVVGDRRGAVFGSLVEAPLRPSNKKYQVNDGTRMPLALDLILKPYNLMLHNVIDSATKNYNKYKQKDSNKN